MSPAMNPVHGSFAADAFVLLRYGVFARMERLIKFVAAAGLAAGALLSFKYAFDGSGLGHALVRGFLPAFCIVSLLVWHFFTSGAVLLCSPSQARLVPRVRRRIVGMVAGGWVILVALCTVAFGTTPDTYPQVALYVGLYSLSLPMSNVRWTIGTALFAAGYAAFFSRMSDAAWRGIFFGWSGAALALIGLPLSLVVVVRTLYPANSERTWEVLHKVERGDRMSRQPF